ncbi:MAG TPA: methyltransferase domain-containing protein [Verrucomicrobiae bacterium]
MNAITEQNAATLKETIQLAEAAFAQADIPAAERHLLAGLAHHPQAPELLLMLGHVYMERQDFAKALGCYDQVAVVHPQAAAVQSSRALALQFSGRVAEAEKAAHHALALDRTDEVALRLLIRINLDAGRVRIARDFCSRLLVLKPKDKQGLRMMMECEMAKQNAATGSLNWTGTGAPAAPAPLAPIPTKPVVIPPPAAVSDKLRQLEGLMGEYAERCTAWSNLGVEHLTQQLVVGDFRKAIEIYPAPTAPQIAADGLPLPPESLTMGYGAGNMDQYLECGRRSYESLTGILRGQGVELGAGDAMLDWGGAAGRVVRNFTAEAKRGCAVWGCDVHAPSIHWAQNHLSPPFRFFNSSALPNLPFPDGHFKFIYGLSVFTHLIALRDLWLLELRRVLHPEGCLILTVHNEATWEWFRQNHTPHWVPKEFRSMAEMPGECIDIRGSRWEHCYTYFHSNYLRRVWGQFFRVADIVPCAEGYQTAVVLRKQ